jgi:hypothetical protein
MVTVEGQLTRMGWLLSRFWHPYLPMRLHVGTRTFGDIANAETVCPSGTVIRYVVMYIGWRIIDYR